MIARPGDRSRITGAILAGGRARRMDGRDKGLVLLAGRPMLEHVLETLRPQVDALLIVANRNRARYANYATVVADTLSGYQGPLAGIASALQAAETRWVVTVPCDVPILPEDLVARMCAALQDADAEVCTVRCGERLQPVFTLMRTDLIDSLLAFLGDGERKIDRWLQRHRWACADFSANGAAFTNINSDAELAAMAATLEARQ